MYVDQPSQNKKGALHNHHITTGTLSVQTNRKQSKQNEPVTSAPCYSPSNPQNAIEYAAMLLKTSMLSAIEYAANIAQPYSLCQ